MKETFIALEIPFFFFPLNLPIAVRFANIRNLTGLLNEEL